MPVKRLSITITGRVQGVGYRYFAQDAANALGLSGWVRNNFDRSVECEVQGEAADLKRFCESLREGPPLSRVTNVASCELPVVKGERSGFEITT